MKWNIYREARDTSNYLTRKNMHNMLVEMVDDYINENPECSEMREQAIQDLDEAWSSREGLDELRECYDIHELDMAYHFLSRGMVVEDEFSSLEP